MFQCELMSIYRDREGKRERDFERVCIFRKIVMNPTNIWDGELCHNATIVNN